MVERSVKHMRETHPSKRVYGKGYNGGKKG
jgi:hypothetical protein